MLILFIANFIFLGGIAYSLFFESPSDYIYFAYDEEEEKIEIRDTSAVDPIVVRLLICIIGLVVSNGIGLWSCIF